MVAQAPVATAIAPTSLTLRKTMKDSKDRKLDESSGSISNSATQSQPSIPGMESLGSLKTSPFREDEAVKPAKPAADLDVVEGIRNRPWKLLIVDDEAEVHEATVFALSGLMVLGRKLAYLHAHGELEARDVLRNNPDIAIILLDVVMEASDSGLRLVTFIREELHMKAVRIVLRTGQPGYAPELEVIQKYDINDYKTKTELTRTRLATAITASIRSFAQILTIDAGREGMARIVAAGSDLFARQGLASFCEGVLEQACGVLKIKRSGIVCAKLNATAGQCAASELQFLAATGRFRRFQGLPLAALADEPAVDAARQAFATRASQHDQELTTLYLPAQSGPQLAVVLDTRKPLGEVGRQLIDVFCASMVVGLQNVTLFERLQDYAYMDSLCGLPNRVRFIQLVDEQISTNRLGWVVGILDVDHFAETNDALGHECGDVLLQGVAARLRDALSTEVTLARVAGDCFGIFGPSVSVDPDQLLELFTTPINVGENSIHVSASIGLVLLEQTAGSGLDAFKNSSIGLNRAKATKRGSYAYFTHVMEVDTRERVKLAHELRRTMDAHKLLLYYQPQIDLSSGRIVGAEALLRWRTADGKFISPDKFVPVAESSGLIRPIGEWVLRTACRQLHNWCNNGLQGFRMAVNVSIEQFRMPNFTDLVRSVIAEHRLDPQLLELEITESMAMDNIDVVIESLRKLKQIGVAIAVDDFGTGYSSLGHIQQLAVDRLKIDRTFVNGLNRVAPGGRERRRNLSSIPEMIIKLGHSLDLQVIAEGVETEQDAECLRALGCDEAQGYLYGKPMDAEAFDQFLCERGLLAVPVIA